MKRVISHIILSVLAVLLLPATAYAAAGFADRAADYEQWMLPAYYYCGIFGLTFLCVLFGLSLVCKTKIRKTAGKISSYLVHHNRLQAIIVARTSFSNTARNNRMRIK